MLAATGAIWFSPRPSLTGTVPFSTAYYDRHGRLLRLGLAADERFRLQTPLAALSPALIAATLAQEDRFFYRHPGVNPFSLIRAAGTSYVRRSRPVGGSTITMQLVRLRDDLDTRKPAGKIVQIIRALQLERYYTKDEILEAYLNLAPYGGNIHGAGTAAQIYFRQTPDALALPQSIALAVIPQNPVRRFPLNANNRPWHDARRKLAARLAAPDIATAQLPLPVYGRDDLPFHAPHFIDSLPPAAAGTVTTTIDLPLQQMLERRLAAWLRHESRHNLGTGAAMLLHIPTMEVRALIGSAHFKSAQVDGTAARRSPGSTLKPFVYALALEQGLIHPETLLADDPVSFAEYRPGNFDKRFIGLIPAREALALSRNIPAIALAARLQKPDLYDFLQQGGAALPRPRTHYGLSLVAGGAETDMRTLVRLYAMLAQGGILRDIKYTSNQITAAPRRLLGPEAALLTLTMLERADPSALPFTAPSAKVPVYWKTGTSNGFRDAWTVGVAGDYVLAVWLGHFDGRSSPALIGQDAAAPLYFDLLNAVAARETLYDRVKPALGKLNLAQIPICRRTGATAPCGDDRMGWFIPGKSPFALPQDSAPEILSPRGGLSYVHSTSAAAPLRIPLEARANAARAPFTWFANNILIGQSDGSAPLFWSPPPGHYIVSFVDSQGHSARQPVTVVSAR